MSPPEIRLAEIAPGLWGMPPRVSASPRVFKRKPTEAEKQAFLDSLGPPVVYPEEDSPTVKFVNGVAVVVGSIFALMPLLALLQALSLL